jgi:hypothetical protein
MCNYCFALKPLCICPSQEARAQFLYRSLTGVAPALMPFCFPLTTSAARAEGRLHEITMKGLRASVVAATGWDLSKSTSGMKMRQLLEQTWSELHAEFWGGASQVGGSGCIPMPAGSYADMTLGSFAQLQSHSLTCRLLRHC